MTTIVKSKPAKKAFETFQRSMASKGFTETPLTKSQFMFLHGSCELPDSYIESVAMDVAAGFHFRSAMHATLSAFYKDHGAWVSS